MHKTKVGVFKLWEYRTLPVFIGIVNKDLTAEFQASRWMKPDLDKGLNKLLSTLLKKPYSVTKVIIV